MKLKSIKIKNFMGFSPDGETIDLDKDLSIFVGETNSGKSGVGRAITFVQDYWTNFIELSVSGEEIQFRTRSDGALLEDITHFSKRISPFEIEFAFELNDSEILLITKEFLKASYHHFAMAVPKEISVSEQIKATFKNISVCVACAPPRFKVILKIEQSELYFTEGGLCSHLREHRYERSSVFDKARYGDKEDSSLSNLLECICDYSKKQRYNGTLDALLFDPLIPVYGFVKKKFLNEIIVLSEYRFLNEKEAHQKHKHETKTGHELASVLYTFKNDWSDELRQKYREIVGLFEQMFGTDMDMDVVDAGGDSTEPKIKITKYGHSLNIEKCGAGIFETLFMITHLCDAQDKIFFIEEPEQHLHPHAQKILSTFLETAAKNNQLLLTTHSLIFADPKHFEKIRLVRWNKSTKINFVDKDALRPGDIQKLKIELEDYAKRNLFFSRYVLLVEGYSEIGAFPRFLKMLEFSPEKEGMLILNCLSKSNYPLFSRLAKALKIPFFCIFDKDAFERRTFGKVFNLDETGWSTIEKLTDDEINARYVSRGAYVLSGNFETSVEQDEFKSELDECARVSNGSKRLAATLFAEKRAKEGKIPPAFEKALRAAIKYFKRSVRDK